MVLGADEPHGLETHAGQAVDLAGVASAARLPKGCMVDHTYWLRFVDVIRSDHDEKTYDH